MKNFFKKQREAVSLFAYAALVVLLVYFVLFPMYRAIGNRQDQIQEEIVSQEMKNKRLQEIPRIKDQYALLKKNENVARVLLRKEDAVGLIENLEHLADETGNTINITTTEANKDVRPVKNNKSKEDTSLVDSLPSSDYLALNLRISGEYENVLNFMHKLENGDYYEDITGIQIRKEETGVATRSNGSGMFAGSGEQNQTAAANDGKLTAIIDVVFYLAK